MSRVIRKYIRTWHVLDETSRCEWITYSRNPNDGTRCRRPKSNGRYCKQHFLIDERRRVLNRRGEPY